MSIRGELPEGYWKQITLTFNPWNEKHWLKARFFDSQEENILAMTANYMCNEFLGDDDRALFEWMKKNKPCRYNIEGLGNWGIAEGAIYENWQEREFDWREIAKRPDILSCFGLDFGYTVDPTAFIACLVDEKQREIFKFDEHHQKAMLNIIEMSNYVWATDKDGKLVNKPIDDYNHLMDALRYATEGVKKRDGFMVFLKAQFQHVKDQQVTVHNPGLTRS